MLISWENAFEEREVSWKSVEVHSLEIILVKILCG
jgi:hypothetical protein